MVLKEPRLCNFREKLAVVFGLFQNKPRDCYPDSKAQRIFTSFRGVDGIIYSYIITCLKALFGQCQLHQII
jgi:hypothetical protein